MIKPFMLSVVMLNVILLSVKASFKLVHSDRLLLPYLQTLDEAKSIC